MKFILFRPLALQSLVWWKKYGLASSFLVNCPICGAENKVVTSKSHSTGHRGPKAFDVNTRAALGALHAGIGHTHLSAITSTMNTPSMSHVTFKTREREIGHAVENVAQNSCTKFIEAEKENVLKGKGTCHCILDLLKGCIWSLFLMLFKIIFG